MIEISSTAQEYFKHLLNQQGEEGLGLRIQVIAPGTPGAECDLQFCPPGGHNDDDERMSFEGFDLFVAANSQAWLNTAEIDYEREGTAGQLSIKAPGIKGQAPAENASLGERVSWVIENEINPMLASHGGRVALADITEKTEVVLQFGGGCHGCGMVDVTLKEGIEKTLVKHFPEISGIVDATDHDTGSNPYFKP